MSEQELMHDIRNEVNSICMAGRLAKRAAELGQDALVRDCLEKIDIACEKCVKLLVPTASEQGHRTDDATAAVANDR
ncbi:hypothetical protein QSH18_17925 [Xanthomonas sp. NCPPB 2654]|uniref:hypothetical protein n=1 Tax=unclassified Xanthomonas TaxID=2643310 RepID=UPI0021E053D6|nr:MULTISPECIES: hypothetical protein [unclassified Xanthomonas]MDL5367492.1 hypothetical protein [Xanthomonas sp. NCPPB 2654]MEB1528720.1 hypothetical protein [Xanthomonas campestris pv. campestris]UYC22544.1 hypothetical protein NUG20_09820 [Xanthomonas sp. CFBP 8443]